MRAVIILFGFGFLLPVSGAVIFPPNNLVLDQSCAIGSSVPATETITITTDSGSVNLAGLPEQNTFLVSASVLSITATPSGGSAKVGINTKALSNGANKAYIGFFVSGTANYLGFVTVEIDCTPQPTVTLTPPTIIPVQTSQGSGPMNLLLKSEIQGTGTGLTKFTMTPDTPAVYSPWIASATVPGYPSGTGAVNKGQLEDLNVSLNPTGLAVQDQPYVGFVHIRDQASGQGAADLTIQMSVTASATGNATLAHFAAGGVYVTDFYVVNSAAQPANFKISFYNDVGNPYSMLVQGQGVVNNISGALGANSSAYFEAGDPSLSVAGGSAHIVADASIGVQALFRLHQVDNTGSHYYEAAVPATAGSMEFVIPFDLTTFSPTGEQIYTGIAIANLDSANTSTVSCIARDLSGNTIPNAVQIPNIAPNGHWAGFSFAALVGKRGTLDCSGTTVIGAIALHAYSVSGAISTLPVVLK